MSDEIAMKTKRREQWAWYLYDFGNSAYAAVVLLAVYSVYFKQGVVAGPEGSALWGLSLTIAMLVVAIIAPFLGTLADYSQKKKSFLFVMTSMAVLFTGLLFFVQKGDIVLGMVLFILAEIGYRSGQVFYNSLLVDVADPDEIGRVSGKGWAIGSLGGILCLIVVLAMIQLNPGNNVVVRLTLVFTAVYFLVFSLPAMLIIKEKKPPEESEGNNYFKIAVKRLKKTIRSVRSFKEFIKFMVALLIYNDGIIAALDFAAIIGAVLFGITDTQLIIFVIIVQITNVIGSYVYALIGERVGYKNSLIQSLLLMILAIVAMMFINGPIPFFIVGAVAGFAMAGVQSVSRTLVSIFAPKSKTAEFYGFFALAGRTSSIVGPGIMGFAASGISAWLMTTLVDTGLVTAGSELAITVTEKIGHRFAIVSIVIFLLVGLMLLLFVNEKEGKLAAEIAEAKINGEKA
ncbi:MAG: MFS transporter [Anaerolineales bacterium]|nr:MFS transporter [Anaerolineales bacterium]